MTDTIYADVQKLEPGDLVDLFDLNATIIGASNLNFHGYTQVGPIVWQGVTFDPWPIGVSGIARTQGQQATPTFTVGNVDGSISAMCQAFQDLVGAELTMHRTLSKYLDGQPGANPTQEFSDTWIVDRKASESPQSVQFELASAMNYAGAQLPSRQIVADVCSAIAKGGYRGVNCQYAGGPVATVMDVPTTNPALDNCSGTLRGCKYRFGENNSLPFGSFPAAGLTRT